MPGYPFQKNDRTQADTNAVPASLVSNPARGPRPEIFPKPGPEPKAHKASLTRHAESAHCALTADLEARASSEMQINCFLGRYPENG